MAECPSCGWEGDGGRRETCPLCLASLVEDADATLTCTHCGLVSPARMQVCPGCLALLRPIPDVVEDVMAHALAAGHHLHRPDWREPFAGGPDCLVQRLVAHGPLVICGGDGLIEAHVSGHDHRAIAPLHCSTDGRTLFHLEAYAPVGRALVAIGADGAALGTYLHTGPLFSQTLDIRDESSAPVARLEPAPRPAEDQYRVVDTAGVLLATVARRDEELDGWIDDEWSLTVRAARVPLRPMAVVALVLAAKVLLGRPAPVATAEHVASGSASFPERFLGDL